MNRPEHRLLLECARIRGEEERGDRILACVSEGVDWEYLQRAAARHMMTSILYRHLNSVCRAVVPPDILDKIHIHYKNNSLNSLLFTAELIKILDLFKRHDIRAVPFKGPVLAYTLYEEPEQREFIDLDILVCKPDVFRALRLLSKLGYGTVPDFSPYIQSGILRNDFHYQVRTADGRNIVELHWNLLPGYLGFELPDPAWLQRTEPALIQGHSIPNLNREDQLVALSLHGYKHMWQSLVWIADIARLLVRHPDLNWGKVFDRSLHPDLERILSVSLLLAVDFLGAPLPEQVYQRVRRNGRSNEIAEILQEACFHPETAGQALRLKRLQFSFISGWTDRCRSLVLFAFRPLPVDFNVVLPRMLYPLYFVLRPVGLLVRYLRRKNLVSG